MNGLLNPGHLDPATRILAILDARKTALMAATILVASGKNRAEHNVLGLASDYEDWLMRPRVRHDS